MKTLRRIMNQKYIHLILLHVRIMLMLLFIKGGPETLRTNIHVSSAKTFEPGLRTTDSASCADHVGCSHFGLCDELESVRSGIIKVNAAEPSSKQLNAEIYCTAKSKEPERMLLENNVDVILHQGGPATLQTDIHENFAKINESDIQSADSSSCAHRAERSQQVLADGPDSAQNTE